MNILTNMDKCYGCGACFNICPVDAIEMKEDLEGFHFPVVNRNKCIQCGKCKEVCPRNKESYKNIPKPDVYAVMGSDEVRETSSSGGVATILAHWVISQNGVVCGASLDDDLVTLRHIFVHSHEDLIKLQKTKYIQSIIGDCYRSAKEYLDKGTLVLFVGTPCQIAGLYAYLGHTTDTKQLITVDLVCHGVPSPKAWKIFMEQNYSDIPMEQVDFRTKTNGGWKGNYDTLISYKDGSSKLIEYDNNPFAKGFLDNNILRKSCYSCQFSHIPRQGDITIGDYWGISKEHPEMNDQKGTSLVLLNNDKGKDVFLKAIIPNCKKSLKTSFELAYNRNGNLMKNSWIGSKRDTFLKTLVESSSFEAANAQKSSNGTYDIGIISWFFSKNYGAVLTSYALYMALLRLGYTPILIDKPSVYEGNALKVDGTGASRRFIYRYCKVSKRFNMDDESDAKRLNNSCTAFMVGSDQLWRYDFIKEMYKYYFLNFTQKKKISYSTSFGGRTYSAPEEIVAHSKELIQKFDAVSVREINGKSICKQLFDVETTHVLDPVFLLERDNYDTLATTSKCRKKGHMFAYMLNYSETKDKILKELAAKLDLELVLVDYQNRPWTSQVMKDIEIEDFLYLIKNSKLVVTDSFHATCFSIIYQVPFISTSDGRAGKDRFTSLLNKCDLSHRLFADFTQVSDTEELYKEPDFSHAENYLLRERIKSLNFLISAIEA